MASPADDGDDVNDIQLAHKHRLSLSYSPLQSSFRVLAIVFYDLDEDDRSNTQTPPTRHHVVGTNDEPCYIGGSICAERAAMIQLRFLPNLRRITKVIISTDFVTPISPGMLCREYFASNNKVPWHVPIVLAGSVCQKCNLDVSSSRKESSAMRNLLLPCSGNGHMFHDWCSIRTTLRQLYPYPSPYVRLDAKEAARLGEEAKAERRSSFAASLSDQARRLLDKAVEAAKRDDRLSLHPIQYGAAVLFSNGEISTEHQRKALEYGCSLDCVSLLAPSIDRNRANGVRPVLLVQADQFGVVHPPFAPARAFLSEHGYADCRVLVPSCSNDGSSTCIIEEVAASELAPNAPDLGKLWDADV